MNQYRSLRDAVWACELIGGSAKLVALRLVEYWPRIFPSMATLARACGLSERTVRSSLRELEEKRIIETRHHMGRSSTYSFVGVSIPDLGTQADSAPRKKLPDTQAESAGPTPAESAAEADPDPKQTREADLPKHVSAAPRPAADAAPKPKGRTPASKTLLSSELKKAFTPNNTDRACAIKLGVDLNTEYPAFIDHHTAKATQMADWHAALRTWLRNAKRFGRGQTKSPIGALGKTHDELDFAK